MKHLAKFASKTLDFRNSYYLWSLWLLIPQHNIDLVEIKTISLQFTDYETVAIGYGGKGLRLDRTKDDNIKEVLEEAINLSRKGDSVLVNALIGKTNFREGSISV